MLELRVALLFVFNAYLFAWDTNFLAEYGMSIARVFGYQQMPHTTPQRVANAMGLVLAGGSLLVLLQITLFPGLQTRAIGFATTVAVLSVVLRQQRFRRVLGRVCLGRISTEHRLGDILVSDALVSLSSVFVDCVLCVQLLVNNYPIADSLNRSKTIGPLTLIAGGLSGAIRIKQCFQEARSTRDKTHLMNLVKYAVGNVPNIIRIQIASVNQFPDIPEITELRAVYEQRLLLALVISATYNYFWDIIMDWKLARLQDEPQSLRFPRLWYYFVAIFDFIARFAFMASRPSEHVVFSLQALELFRRGVWIIFRVESEPPELNDIEL